MTDNEVLLRSLQAQRRHVVGIVDGLAADELRRPVLPSGWSPVGLVNHLAVDVERWWFRAVVAGDREAWDSFGPLDKDAWTVPDDVTPADVLARYRDECERADEIILSTPIDAAPVAWPEDMFGDWRLPDLRRVLLHAITETACHAGHLDAARELIDGRQWMTL